MKKLLLMVMMIGSVVGCTRVPPGQVGIKVYLNGGAKGVDHEVLGVGRYWIGMNEELYLFPTFQQNYTWTTNGDTGDESITFQTKEGMSINLDVGISYSVDPLKIPVLFQKYRKGVNEITDIILRNAVRDALNDYGTEYTVEENYSTKKTELFDRVKDRLTIEFKENGILIDNIYAIGSMRLPDNVVAALNAKIEATQKAQRVENEVLEAKAEAEKNVALARGTAEANRIKLQSITPQLIEFEKLRIQEEAIKKWNGSLPTYNGGGAVPFINVN